MARKQSKKTARKSKASAKVTAQLPKGYTAIGGFAKSWPNDDTKPGDMIEGVIGETREVTTGTGKQKRTVQVMDFETNDGEVFNVWESAGLAALFEYEEGTEACIIYEGRGKAKRGMNAPKLFRVGVAE